MRGREVATLLVVDRHVCFRMTEFITTTTPTDITTTAFRAEAAVKQALTEGVDVVTLSAALDVSPKLIYQIDDGALLLVQIHPLYPRWMATPTLVIMIVGMLLPEQRPRG